MIHASLLVEPRRSEIAPGVAVLRALPTRARRLVGAWCFLDHFGPVAGDAMRAFDVGVHPHIGLQTATWLFEGSLLHRDSLGSVQSIRAGELNLMTAGSGIAHSEHLGADATRLHGLQFWIALPDAARDIAPRFEHHADLPHWHEGGVSQRLFIGDFAGRRSPAQVHSPLLGLELHAAAPQSLALPLDRGFEHALYVADGHARCQGIDVPAQRLLVLSGATDAVPIELAAGTRAVLIGGAPFSETPLMWWNFVARGHAEIAAARDDWVAHRRFGDVSEGGSRIDAPPFDLHLRAPR
ncbi:MAG TPA: pirin family protein [Patescibacteria group bacterium]|nr:pirin family protein [Patescibacteria group bacterium]